MKEIEVNNLSKIFGNNPQEGIELLKEGYSKDEILEKTGLTVGVNDVSFKVNTEEIFVIMGLSGSGKSTLLRCLNRLIEPTAGELKLKDQNLMDLDQQSLRQMRRDKFGMVFQNFALFPNRTVLENAEFGLEIQDVPKEEREVQAKEALKRVGLDGWEDQYPEQLSGGMQQRVGLARALAVDPEILLMDEPFSALDPLIKKEMQDELLDIYQDLDKTILFITHDLDEALKLGDRIAIMNDGKIVQIGTPEEILTDAENDYVKEFVQDVNRSRILTAEDIMTKPLALLYDQDGPHTAMHKMRQNEISSIFVVDKERKLKGIVEIEDAVEGVNKGQKDLEGIMKETPTTNPDENLDELFSEIADLDIPLPVINDEGKLLGLIIKSNVLANLASEERV
ncbi:quaternary amine ABC transporter ATP-binding protein [Acetohalobium arabaticum]|uniref:Quaternary amine transport ATP-binding protein n=1 Tax=Acetohalobium arabaticum (strain ATCC 49924 / DSM 5501 / Z-7288) TaxID=574087 RepID=D9QUS1_ACEAZ|nr:betaine/proline/choline family ABC transporter ATP-binding protein [Acetohalobium arabaticum]ADL11980.1 glycine betaine/L-proline ABC transporter, ATPase subunit [Acetohalobium arabaticum DSM 5501]